MPGSEKVSRILMVGLVPRRSAAARVAAARSRAPKHFLDDGTADDKHSTHSRLVYRKLPTLSSALQISRYYGPQNDWIGLRHELYIPSCVFEGQKHTKGSKPETTAASHHTADFESEAVRGLGIYGIFYIFLS